MWLRAQRELSLDCFLDQRWPLWTLQDRLCRNELPSTTDGGGEIKRRKNGEKHNRMFGVLQGVAEQHAGAPAALTPGCCAVPVLSVSPSLSPSRVPPLFLLTSPFLSFSIISHPLFPGEVGLRQ